MTNILTTETKLLDVIKERDYLILIHFSKERDMRTGIYAFRSVLMFEIQKANNNRKAPLILT